MGSISEDEGVLVRRLEVTFGMRGGTFLLVRDGNGELQSCVRLVDDGDIVEATVLVLGEVVGIRAQHLVVVVVELRN